MSGKIIKLRFNRASSKFGEICGGPLGNSMRAYKHLLQGFTLSDKINAAIKIAETEEDFHNVEVFVTEFERTITDLNCLSKPGHAQKILRVHQESFALELRNFKNCEEQLNVVDRKNGNILIEQISELLNVRKSDGDALIACNSASKFRNELVCLTDLSR